MNSPADIINQYIQALEDSHARFAHNSGSTHASQARAKEQFAGDQRSAVLNFEAGFKLRARSNAEIAKLLAAADQIANLGLYVTSSL